MHFSPKNGGSIFLWNNIYPQVHMTLQPIVISIEEKGLNLSTTEHWNNRHVGQHSTGVTKLHHYTY